MLRLEHCRGKETPQCSPRTQSRRSLGSNCMSVQHRVIQTGGLATLAWSKSIQWLLTNCSNRVSPGSTFALGGQIEYRWTPCSDVSLVCIGSMRWQDAEVNPVGNPLREGGSFAEQRVVQTFLGQVPAVSCRAGSLLPCGWMELKWLSVATWWMNLNLFRWMTQNWSLHKPPTYTIRKKLE